MLCPIKDVDFSTDCFCSDQIGLLGHVSRSVDFAVVVDRLFDVDSGC